jgi:arylsulfatase A-like enzyme
MQGRSFKPLLMGETAKNWRKSIYYHYYDHGIHNVARHDGVRNDRYKLIHFYTDDVWELYDLKEDPHEVNNVYGKQEYERVTNNLKEELERLRKQYEVPAAHFEPPYVKADKNQQL